LGNGTAGLGSRFATLKLQPEDCGGVLQVNKMISQYYEASPQYYEAVPTPCPTTALACEPAFSYWEMGRSGTVPGHVWKFLTPQDRRVLILDNGTPPSGGSGIPNPCPTVVKTEFRN